jgi:GTPase
MFTLAIIGRPNVGKSTLFNRLAGKQLAIVNDQPGVTRDWREAEGNLFGRTFRVLDTAGLEEKFDDSIQARMRKQTDLAIAQADVILFVIDGRHGLTPMDEHFAAQLRKQKKPVILGVNKCENEKTSASGLAESYKLGLGEPIAISAAHGEGMEELFHALSPYFPEEADEDEYEENEDGDYGFSLDEIEGNEEFEFVDVAPEKTIKIAIVGRPNVGKSTLLNKILNEDRVMTGPEAGITRDSIAVDWDYKGHPFRLVDTAGMRRRAKVENTIEKMSVEDSMRAIRLAQVVVLVVEASAMLEKQDIQIADHVLQEGRALVIAINKWDAVDEHRKTLDEIQYRMETSLAQVKDIPYVTMSAITGKNVDRLLETILSTYAIWNKRIKTSGLNRWLKMMESRNAAPLVDGRSNRLKYITQVKTRPPTFALWASRADELPEMYKRFIINGLRNDFDIPGVPIRLLVRKSKNPFAD